MIIGMGSDLCNIERIQNSLDRFGERSGDFLVMVDVSHEINVLSHSFIVPVR